MKSCLKTVIVTVEVVDNMMKLLATWNGRLLWLPNLWHSEKDQQNLSVLFPTALLATPIGVMVQLEEHSSEIDTITVGNFLDLFVKTRPPEVAMGNCLHLPKSMMIMVKVLK